MKVMQKLKSNVGFTLAEVLAAVLILLMVSGIVAAGIPSAKNAYDKAVNAANAKVLLSTTVTSLRNELGKANNIITGDAAEGSSDSSISYLSAETGSYSKIYKDTGATQKIMIQEYMVLNPETGALIEGSTPRSLVSDTAATGKLYVTYKDFDYTPGSNIITINNLTVKDFANGDKEMASLDSLVIRIIALS